MELKEYKATIRALAHLSVLDRLIAYQDHDAVRAAGPLHAHEREVRDKVLKRTRRLPLTWYHGGLIGREVGSLLLPARLTGADPRGEGDAYRVRKDHVYISHKRDVAERYVQRNRRQGHESVVYVVKPQGDLKLDLENLRMEIFMSMDPATRKVLGNNPLSRFCMFTCESAKVLEVIEVPEDALA